MHGQATSPFQTCATRFRYERLKSCASKIQLSDCKLDPDKEQVINAVAHLHNHGQTDGSCNSRKRASAMLEVSEETDRGDLRATHARVVTINQSHHEVNCIILMVPWLFAESRT